MMGRQPGAGGHGPDEAQTRPGQIAAALTAALALLTVQLAVRLTAALLTSALLLPVGAATAGSVLAAPSEIVVMLEAAPKTLHPFYATDATGVRISHQLIFDTLLRLDDQLRIAPGLAESWSRPKPKRFRFKIRRGVRFHDGAKLDARDVEHTLRTLMAPETASPYGAVLRDKIASLRRDGSHVLEITLKAPYAAFLSDLVLPVVPRKAGAAKALVGSGPFRFLRRSPNEIVLERNADYYATPAAVERIVLKVVRDESTRLLKLRKGDIDLAVNVLPLDKLARFAKGPLSQRYRLLEAPGLSYQYLGFNLADPILAKKKVRRAIVHAVNVDALIIHRQRGHSTRATGLLPPSSPFADPALRPPVYDPALAAKLLDEAGFPERNGVRFTLKYKTSTDRAAVIQARIVKSDLRKIGIAVTVRSYEWGTFYEDISRGNFQLFSLRWIGVNDPDFTYELFHSSRIPPKGRNRGRFSNTQVDRLLERGRLERDPAKRQQIYRELNRILEEELPYMSLWHNNNVAIVAKRLEGFRLHPTGGFQYLPQTRIASP